MVEYYIPQKMGLIIHALISDKMRSAFQKQVSSAWTSNDIPQILWNVITCPCPWYLLLEKHFLTMLADEPTTREPRGVVLPAICWLICVTTITTNAICTITIESTIILQWNTFRPRLRTYWLNAMHICMYCVAAAIITSERVICVKSN